MKAAINTKYGSPQNLKVISTSIPDPGADEILIKVMASAVTKADTMMRKGIPRFSRLFMGLTKPKTEGMGTGFAGIVEKVGKNVSAFKVGDEVFGETGMTFGANAEYLTTKVSNVILPKPGFLDFSEAATLTDGFLTSFNFLTQLSKISKGNQVLIIGASGSLGTAAIQIAKHYGAIVTGVSSSGNEKLVLHLGADKHIDYKIRDYHKEQERYDVIFDTIGVSSFIKSKKILKKKGTYLSPVLNVGLLFSMMLTSFSKGRKAIFSATGLLPADKLKQMLGTLMDNISTAKMKIVIDRKYHLSEIKEAHEYVDSNRKIGNIVLVV